MSRGQPQYLEPVKEEMMQKAKSIIIAGGGIGGLSAAVGLSKHGFKVTVLERAPVLGEIGAGLQLGPNAFHAFDYLGIGDEARRMAVYVDKLRLIDATTAEDVAEIDLGEAFRKRFRNPYAVAHRGDLHGVYVRACRSNPSIDLRTGCNVIGYEQDGSSVRAILETGESVEGAMLIGADGLWSNIRNKVVGDGAPRVTGHTTYRSVIPTDQMPEDLRWNAATLWAGPKCHIVHYPLSGWKTFNLVVTCHNDASAPVSGLPVADREVLEAFSHVHPRAQSIIRHGQNWKLWVLCDRDPVDTWIDGRVALLGDAAHPTLQYLAQGACMAMEDGVALSLEVAARPEDPESALLAYQNRRRVRTARIQLTSRAIGDHIYHPAGVHAALRNSIMSEKSQEEWYDALDWLYGAQHSDAAAAASFLEPV